mmetsp:Transcript_6093/g.9344  ORF Transcript_6093/g.9344 Transcript_6093/m.9344 type:complete len:300 (-) Transcript_6093:27-926(-)
MVTPKYNNYESISQVDEEENRTSNEGQRRKSLASWLWKLFLVTVWVACIVFGLYTLCFYVRVIAMNKIEYWDLNHSGMYYKDRWDSNSSLSVHFICASYIMLLGTFQFVPWIRRKYQYRFHRWNGRILILTSLAGALGGIYYIAAVGVSFEPRRQANVMNMLFGVSVIVCAVNMYYCIAWKEDIDQHKLWAYRFAGLFLGNIFVRLYNVTFRLICGSLPLWGSTLLQYIFFTPFLILATVIWKTEYSSSNDDKNFPSNLSLAFAIFGITWFVMAVVAQSLLKWIPFMIMDLQSYLNNSQ